MTRFRYLLLTAGPANPSPAVIQHSSPEGASQRGPSPIPPRSSAGTGSGTARDEILAAAHKLTGQSADGTFTLMQVVAEMRRAGSRYAESTIRTHVTSRMCVDAPIHHARTYDDFERIGHGRYRLRPATHPANP